MYTALNSPVILSSLYHITTICDHFFFVIQLFHCLWAGIAQSVYRLATGWKAQGSNGGGKRDFPYPSRPFLGPTRLLHKGYRVFPGGKAVEAWRWPPTISSVEIKERAQLHIYSPSGPSWPVLGRTLAKSLALPFISSPVCLYPPVNVHTFGAPPADILRFFCHCSLTGTLTVHSAREEALRDVSTATRWSWNITSQIAFIIPTPVFIACTSPLLTLYGVIALMYGTQLCTQCVPIPSRSL